MVLQNFSTYCFFSIMVFHCGLIVAQEVDYCSDNAPGVGSNLWEHTLKKEKKKTNS